MTVDERLRDAHSRIPDPDPAATARARARLTAALAPAPVRRRRRFASLLPVAALIAIAFVVVLVVTRGDDPALEREATPTATAAAPRATGPISYERNTFAISIRYIGPDGRSTARPGDAAYGIARSVPEEIWRAPDGSGRLHYGAESEPYLPSSADERAWRAAGSPDLKRLAGPVGRWGPKTQNYGPGEFDDALLFNSNLEQVLPKRDPLSVVPSEPHALATWLNAAAEKQRPGQPRGVVHDAVISDALTFLRDPRATRQLRLALIDVLSTLVGARRVRELRDGAGRAWAGIDLIDGTVIAFDPGSGQLMARGARFKDAVRWNYTYSVESAGVTAIGERP